MALSSHAVESIATASRQISPRPGEYLEFVRAPDVALTPLGYAYGEVSRYAKRLFIEKKFGLAEAPYCR